MCADIDLPPLADGFEFHCFIAFSYANLKIVEELWKYLKSKGFKVSICTEFKLGKALSDNIEECVKKSRRVIAMISKDYIESRYFDHETLLFIHNNSTHKRQLLIPVCIGLSEEEMKATRLGVYSYQYLDYKGSEIDQSRIAQAVAGPDIPLSVSLPCGNVAQGLVWSFYYGYLKLIMPTLESRCLASKFANVKDIPLIPTVFILIPNNGLCHNSITECDANIVSAGSLVAVTANRAGVKARDYNNYIYKVKGPNGEEFYAPCEYATPVLSMYEMSQEGLAGLTQNEMRHQIRNFKDLLDQVLSHSRMSGSLEYMFRIIFFETGDDGKAHIASRIVKSIQHIQSEKQEAQMAAVKQMEKLELHTD